MGQIFVSCFSKSFVAAILSSIGFIVWSPAWAQPAATKFGTFCGSPVVEFENDGRKIKLREDFCFKDDKNRVWQVPKDYVVDGASIPQAFWSFIGGPLDGAYRNASIIHVFFVIVALMIGGKCIWSFTRACAPPALDQEKLG